VSILKSKKLHLSPPQCLIIIKPQVEIRDLTITDSHITPPSSRRRKTRLPSIVDAVDDDDDDVKCRTDPIPIFGYLISDIARVYWMTLIFTGPLYVVQLPKIEAT
jgi:hypothetical protein